MTVGDFINMIREYDVKSDFPLFIGSYETPSEITGVFCEPSKHYGEVYIVDESFRIPAKLDEFIDKRVLYLKGYRKGIMHGASYDLKDFNLYIDSDGILRQTNPNRRRMIDAMGEEYVLALEERLGEMIT